MMEKQPEHGPHGSPLVKTDVGFVELGVFETGVPPHFRLYFFDEHTGSGKTKQIIFSVKAGHIGPAPIRDLWGVLERETAQIGVLISMEEPTKAMRTEVAKAGFYERPSGGKDERYPRLQLLTIEELLKGKGIAYPAFRANVTFKKAPKAEEERTEARLPFDE